MLLSYQDRRLIRAIVLFQKYRDRKGLWAWGIRNYAKLRHMLWTIISGSDINRNARIDLSARFPHLSGVVIHKDVVIHANCMIMQQVTLGQLGIAGAPIVENGAYIGAGAKVLGPITIGSGARIGANAVVLQDVPAGATAVGVPARILPARPDRKE